ncbi:MAG: hypothetical protein EXR72_07215 [Myxococcales bacterium]|nr:hypothetical protein [Myxococcales bacterium]
MRHPPLLVLALFSLGSAACSDDAPPGTPAFESNCTVAEPGVEAKKTAGHQEDGSVILPGGRRISPSGRLLDVGGFPLAVRVLPQDGGRYVVVTDGGYGDEALRIIDLKATDPHQAIVAQHDYPRTSGSPHAPALFFGMALTKDGKRLYVSNGGHDPVADSVPTAQHYNPIDVFDLAGSPPKLVRNDPARIKLFFSVHDGGAPKQRLPAGITLSSDEKLLYVATQTDGSLAIIDLAPAVGSPGFGQEIGRAPLPGIGPYDVAVDEASHTAFVSMWGGQKVGQNRYVDGVAVVDVANPKAPLAAPALVMTGKGAEGELLVGSRLFVANADADTISVIDVAAKTVKSAPASLGALLGSSPNHIAVDEKAGRLYIANANENAVQVLDLTTLESKGRIPTAWYPTAVAVQADGGLVIASAKGLGLGPTDHEKGKNDFMQGTLQVVARPTELELIAGEKTVRDNLERPRHYQAELTCPASGEKRFPLPADEKSPTPIKYVFLIVRENKTYDAVLGDLEGTNGDPKLAIFGSHTAKGDITPNAHAIAKAFSNLDNFYANAEQSLQGHEWTTAAFSNDYTEKAWSSTWGRAYRPVGAFASGTYEHLPQPGSDTIWTHFDRFGVAYHNYGEIVNTAGALHLYDVSYPGVFFDTGTPDMIKIQYVLDQLNDPNFVLEPFSYIGLPNDHTVGTTPGKPTPESMVADNDEATGKFLDALSHSKYWASSIVFVIEDDPQDGGDHVEGHRSLCLVASPWVKRGHVSSVHTDDPALWRTINLLLGVPPMNLYDGNAAAMYDLFAAKPDLAPYTYIPRKVPAKLNTADAPFAAESSKIDFTLPDSAPLGRILWHAMRGTEPPWGAKASPREGSDDVAHRACCTSAIADDD